MAEEQQPVGVHLGAGGDPLILGLPAFSVGSVALGLGLLHLPAGLPIVAPIIFFSTGIFLLISTLWAIILGISIVACIFGTFGGFWLTLGTVLIGTQHGWFGIPPDGLGAALQMLFISYDVLFLMVLIPTLRLPLAYPLIIVLVEFALSFAAAGVNVIAGLFVLAFAVVGLYAFVNVAQTAMGAKSAPPLGAPPLG